MPEIARESNATEPNNDDWKQRQLEENLRDSDLRQNIITTATKTAKTA